MKITKNETEPIPLDVQIIQKRWLIKNFYTQIDIKKKDIKNLELEIEEETKVLKEMEQKLKTHQ